MDDPRAITAGSIMPAYPWMLTSAADFSSIESVMRAHRILGVPYTDEEIAGGEVSARAQAQAIADEIVVQGGPDGLADKQIVALIAYLQRLGTDITKPEPVAAEEEGVPVEESVAAEVAEAAVELAGEAS
jgi:cytochrome c oxidase cbb3-type subunit I/II